MNKELKDIIRRCDRKIAIAQGIKFAVKCIERGQTPDDMMDLATKWMHHYGCARDTARAKIKN